MSSILFADFPGEIIEMILIFSGPKSFGRFCLTSKVYAKLLPSTRIWKIFLDQDFPMHDTFYRPECYLLKDVYLDLDCWQSMEAKECHGENCCDTLLTNPCAVQYVYNRISIETACSNLARLLSCTDRMDIVFPELEALWNGFFKRADHPLGSGYSYELLQIMATNIANYLLGSENYVGWAKMFFREFLIYLMENRKIPLTNELLGEELEGMVDGEGGPINYMNLVGYGVSPSAVYQWLVIYSAPLDWCREQNIKI